MNHADRLRIEIVAARVEQLHARHDGCAARIVETTRELDRLLDLLAKEVHRV